MKKEELREIKKGEVGTGLLIENDGYMSLSATDGNKAIMEAARGMDSWHVPYPFIVDAVFQKYDIKNANGRVYPERVLKKQVKLYQQKIDEHRAYGECYKPDALVLSEGGWVKLEDIKEGDMILTLNPETNEIEKKPVIRKVEYDFDGDMIHIHGRNIDDVVTPEHGYPIYDRNGKFREFKTAQEIMESDSINDLHIPTSMDSFDDGACIDTLEADKEHYNGKVMCVEVENHIWYVMCNGKCHWTKNCNHPTDSTINLSRVSHNIIELHWDGRTLVGKMEINTSEGFRRNGIVTTCGDEVANLLLNGYKIGVSSRGVGSVEEKLGQTVVGDDFELICWDVVSDPSTPNAYISAHGEEELATYIESDESKSDKSPIREMVGKINKILD